MFQDHGFTVAPDVVQDLAALCGNLPLALRIVAANLTSYQAQDDARAYVRRLRDGDRLGGLSVPGDPQWRCAPRSHRPYQRLGGAERRRWTARLDPTDCFTTEDLAALADVDWSTADAMLRTLTSSHLVRPARDGRFVTHDLIRLYAAEQSQHEDTADQRAEALGRR